MTRLLLFAALFSVTHLSYSQNQPTKKGDHINLNSYLIELQQISGTDSIIHIDSAYSFQVTIPKWWRIRETPPNLFGGTFPAIDSIENALMIKCFKKAEFKTLDDFEKYVIKDYGMGQTPKWSSRQQILIKKSLKDFQEVGNAYKVQLMWSPKIYDCCYILTETSTAYIWIDFTATGTTYPKNFEKFKEVVSLFKKF